MSEITRQQLCAALNISESTVRRLEQVGLPYTPVGTRRKRYCLEECKTWLKQNEGRLNKKTGDPKTSRLHLSEQRFVESYKTMRLRVKPS